jgi:hypothetical protein
MTALADAFDWIDDNQRQERPTEAFVPISVGIRPVWDHTAKFGGWGAEVTAAVPILHEPLWECDHVHDGEEAAWACGESFVAIIVRNLVPEPGSDPRSASGG